VFRLEVSRSVITEQREFCERFTKYIILTWCVYYTRVGWEINSLSTFETTPVFCACHIHIYIYIYRGSSSPMLIYTLYLAFRP
jgi:hypothetical protein